MDWLYTLSALIMISFGLAIGIHPTALADSHASPKMIRRKRILETLGALLVGGFLAVAAVSTWGHTASLASLPAWMVVFGGCLFSMLAVLCFGLLALAITERRVGWRTRRQRNG